MAGSSATIGHDPDSPTENSKSKSVKPIVTRRVCSKCSKTARLALLARNAVKNYDLQRALDLLEEIQEMQENGGSEEALVKGK